MKRKMTLIFLVFFFAKSQYSQTKNDSIKKYNEIKNWAVARLTIAYIEDLKGWDSVVTIDKFKNKEEEQEWETYKDIKAKYTKYTTKIDLKDLSNKLSIGWGITRDSVFEKYKSELVDNTENLDFENIAFLPKMSKTDKKPELDKKRERAIQEINKQYKKSLLNSIEVPKSIEERNTVGLKDEILSKTNNPKNSSILIYVIIGLSLIFNIFFIFKMITGKKNRDLKKIKQLEEHRKYWEGEYEKSKQEIKNLKKNNEDFIAQIKQLRENKFQKTKSEHVSKREEQNIKGSNQNSSIQRNEENIETKPISNYESPNIVNFDKEKPKTTLIYLPAPFEDKRFASEDATEVKTTSSLYVANIKQDNSEGSVSLIESADLSRALNSPNIYLEKVCDYENVYTPNAKGIKVIEEGTIFLEEQDWVVKNKIKIKFI